MGKMQMNLRAAKRRAEAKKDFEKRVEKTKYDLVQAFDHAVVKLANEILSSRYRYGIKVSCISFENQGSPTYFKNAKWVNGQLVYDLTYVGLDLLGGMEVNVGNLTPEQAAFVNIGMQQAWLLFTNYEAKLKERIPTCFHKNIDYVIGRTVDNRG